MPLFVFNYGQWRVLNGCIIVAKGCGEHLVLSAIGGPTVCRVAVCLQVLAPCWQVLRTIIVKVCKAFTCLSLLERVECSAFILLIDATKILFYFTFLVLFAIFKIANSVISLLFHKCSI